MSSRRPRRPSGDGRPPLQMPGGRRIPRVPDDPRRSPPLDGEDAGIASALAKAGGEIAAVAAAVRACDACTRASSQRAFGSGSPRARLLLVKEQPGPDDLRAQTAMAAEALALERAFERLGIELTDVFATTAVRCATRDAQADELRACSSHLLVEIEAVQPRVVVAFGPRTLDALHALDGRCGLRIPDEVDDGTPVQLRTGLQLLLTESLPAGVTNEDSKRRLWSHLRLLPGMLGDTGA